LCSTLDIGENKEEEEEEKRTKNIMR